MYVGLTGGIGSGKSALAALLAEQGAHVIDADLLARQVVSDEAQVIEGQLGPGLLASDGSVNRAALAARIFSDPAARAWLESLVHPEVARRAAALRAGLPPDAVVVYDVALLAEKGMRGQFDAVIVVTAPVEQRLARLEQRGVPRDDALARMAAQASDEERARIADIVVDNSGSMNDLRESAAGVWRQLATYA